MKRFLLNNSSAFISLLSKLQEGIVIHSEDTSILYANPSAATILGLSEEELLGKTATNNDWYFVDENHKKIPIQDYPVNHLLNKNDSLQDMILGIHTSNKKITWVDISGSITTDDQGNRVALVVFSDITARKEAYDKAELFMRLVESVDTGITITDPNQEDNPIIYTNKAFSDITGYTQEDVIGKNCRLLQNEDKAQDQLTTLRDAIIHTRSAEVLLRNYTKDGNLFYNLLNISPIFDGEKLKYFVGVQHDITKQKEQEELLHEQSLYIKSILDAQEGIVIVSDGIKLVYANQALLNFFGLTCTEEFTQKYKSLCDLCLEEGNSLFTKDHLENLALLLTQAHQVTLKDHLGEIHYFTLYAKQIFDERYVLTLYDITPSIKRNQLLENKAFRDGLTQLFNRQYFYEYFAQERIKQGSLTGIILTDIDNFKSINDTYGHAKGDEVLKNLAKTLLLSLRPNDTVIRWGGEEFVIIIDTKTIQEVSAVAQKLRHAVERIVLSDICPFTSSFGATLLYENEDIESAIARADKALYRAKTNGKNRVETL